MKEALLILIGILGTSSITAVVTYLLYKRRTAAETRKTEMEATKIAVEIETSEETRKFTESKGVVDSLANVATTIEGLLVRVEKQSGQIQELTIRASESDRRYQECLERETDLKEIVEREQGGLKRAIARIQEEVAAIDAKVGK